MVTKFEIQALKKVEQYNDSYTAEMSTLSGKGPLVCTKYYLSEQDYANSVENNSDKEIQKIIREYGTLKEHTLPIKEEVFVEL